MYCILFVTEKNNPLFTNFAAHTVNTATYLPEWKHLKYRCADWRKISYGIPCYIYATQKLQNSLTSRAHSPPHPLSGSNKRFSGWLACDKAASCPQNAALQIKYFGFQTITEFNFEVSFKLTSLSDLANTVRGMWHIVTSTLRICYSIQSYPLAGYRVFIFVLQVDHYLSTYIMLQIFYYNRFRLN